MFNAIVCPRMPVFLCDSRGEADDTLSGLAYNSGLHSHVVKVNAKDARPLLQRHDSSAW